MEENREFEAEIPDGAAEQVQALYDAGGDLGGEVRCAVRDTDESCTVGEAMARATAALEGAEQELRLARGEADDARVDVGCAEGTEQDGACAADAAGIQDAEAPRTEAESDVLCADMEALRSAFPDLELSEPRVMNRERYAALRAAGASPAEAFAATNMAMLMSCAQRQRVMQTAGKAHLVGVAHKSGRAFTPTMSAEERRIAREFFGDGFSDRELDKLYAKAVRGA